MSNFRVVAIKEESNLYDKSCGIDESSSRCGEIYVGDDATNWTFVCTLCDGSFREIDEFMIHIKSSHVNIPPPPSVEPCASGLVSMQENSFKTEGPSLITLDNAVINEFVDYNDFLGENVDTVADDNLSECSQQTEVPVNQVEKPDTHGFQRESSSDVEKIPKSSRSSNWSVESSSPCPSINQSTEVECPPRTVVRIKKTKQKFCLICKRKFQYPSLYRNHMVKHTTDKPFQCSICKKYFKSKQSLRHHSKTHDRKESFKCKVCSLGFYNENELDSHMKTHKGDKTDPCEVRGKLIRTKAVKMVHMEKHTADRPFGCKFCSRSFRMRRHLGNHLKLHFTYRCDSCGNQFRNGAPLKKPYTCPECCNPTGADMRSMHLDYDDDEDEDSEDYDDEEKDVTFHPVKYSKEPNKRRRHICERCNKVYTSKRGLTVHMSMKH